MLRDPGDAAPLRPAESLADLPGILAFGRDAGLRVTSTVDAAGRFSAGAQSLACTVIREGLANAARHAGPGSTVAVDAHRDGDDLVVSVADSGPVSGWQAHPGGGVGLSGLRERVAALGGELQAGPEGTGWRLRVRIPDPPIPGQLSAEPELETEAETETPEPEPHHD